MPKQGSAPRTKVSRLKQDYYDFARTLSSSLYKSEYAPNANTVSTERERREISRRINRLGDAAGINHANLSHRETYIEAIKTLGGSDGSDKDALRLRALAEQIGERVQAALKAKRAAATEQKLQRKFPSKGDRLEAFGVRDGDVLLAQPADDLKPGELAVIRWKDEAGKIFYWPCRVREVDDDGITVDSGENESFYERDEICETLRVTHVIRAINTAQEKLNDADREAKIAALKKRIEKVREQDDWEVSLSSTLFKLEKQLYDLEFPIDLEDWSKWEEKGEAAA